MDSTILPESSDLSPARASVRSRVLPLVKAALLACWPALAATALFLAVMAYEIAAVKAIEGGHFIYPLDDTYGHMATAKNLLQRGVWTYNHANGFESSISSLLYPLVIAACFAVFGLHEYIPLVINIVAIIAALFYMGEILRRTTGSGVLSLLVLCVIVIFGPLPAVVATGMEHSIQILLSVVFVDLAARLLMDGSERVTNVRTPWWLCVVGVLLVMTRYEGMFFIMAVGLLLLCRKRWKLAVTLGVVSFAPIILFGLFSRSQGWDFLPNPIVLKGNTHLPTTLPEVVEYFRHFYTMLVSEPHIPALAAVAVVALIGALQRSWNVWTYPALMSVITIIVSVQHLQFASIGWFYRYEAYMIVLVILGAGLVLGSDTPPGGFRYWLRPSAIPHVAALALAVVFVAVPCWPRTRDAYPFIITASHSIYGQQYQMARFIKRFYRNRGIIANDVCAMSYWANDIRLLDIAGLCNVETMRLRLNGQFDPEWMRKLSVKYRSDIAIVYEDWAVNIFGGPLPEWVKVGTWTIPYNTICAGPTVTFYATSPEKAPELVSKLQQFAADLPKDVVQEGIYRGTEPSAPAAPAAPEAPATPVVP